MECGNPDDPLPGQGFAVGFEGDCVWGHGRSLLGRFRLPDGVQFPISYQLRIPKSLKPRIAALARENRVLGLERDGIVENPGSVFHAMPGEKAIEFARMWGMVERTRGDEAFLSPETAAHYDLDLFRKIALSCQWIHRGSRQRNLPSPSRKPALVALLLPTSIRSALCVEYRGGDQYPGLLEAAWIQMPRSPSGSPGGRS